MWRKRHSISDQFLSTLKAPQKSAKWREKKWSITQMHAWPSMHKTYKTPKKCMEHLDHLSAPFFIFKLAENMTTTDSSQREDMTRCQESLQYQGKKLHFALPLLLVNKTIVLRLLSPLPLLFINTFTAHYLCPNPLGILGIQGSLEHSQGWSYCDEGVNWSPKWQMVTGILWWFATLLFNCTLTIWRGKRAAFMKLAQVSSEPPTLSGTFSSKSLFFHKYLKQSST